MGLTTEGALLLTRVSSVIDNPETVVCLGNPKSHIQYNTFCEFARQLGIKIPPAISSREHSDDTIDSDEFFQSIGFDDYQVLDIDDYQGANIVQDLSEDTLESTHHGVADLVYDTGTLEHVYNLDIALKNIHKLLNIGGLAYHVNPSNGYLDHGFYQISPTLYHDYYRESGYDIIGGGLVDTELGSRYEIHIRDYTQDVYRNRGPEWVVRNLPRVNLHFCAQKLSDSHHATSPVQSYYRQMHSNTSIDYSTQLNFSHKIKQDPVKYYGYTVARMLGVVPTARQIYQAMLD